MPIKQQRMIDMISAAEHCIQSRDDLIVQVSSSMDLRAQGIITEREMIQQIESAFGATAPRVPIQILIATERKHFKDWAKRNDYTANRRAKVKAGLLAEQFTTLREAPKRERGPKWGMVGSSRFNPSTAEVAKAQRAATPTVGDAGSLFDATPEDISTAPTAEQLAADDELAANLDQDEMAAHIAANRKGDQ